MKSITERMGEGMEVGYAEEPYAAMGELSRKPQAYRAVVLSLQGVYQEELRIVSSIKQRFPHVEIYLSHTDGRYGAMAEGVRLGVHGVVSEDGIHRTGVLPGIEKGVPYSTGATQNSTGSAQKSVAAHQKVDTFDAPGVLPVEKLDLVGSEPVLTAEELKALLDEEPIMPPVGGREA